MVRYLVEPLSPMALPDAQAAASSGFRLFCLTGCGDFEALIDWGQSIYHFRTTQKRRVLWFFKKSHRIQMLASGTKRIKMKRSISA